MNVKEYLSPSSRSMIKIRDPLRNLILVSGLMLAIIPVRAGDYLSGYIRVLPESPETNEYKIQINLITSYGSIDYAVPEELYFGDGTPAFSLDGQVPDTVLEYRDSDKFIFSVFHHYPGPGTYTIGCSMAFRYGGAINEPDNYWVPFYIETRFTVDPFVGINHTPEIRNQYIFRNREDQPLDYTISAADYEKDSMSYSLKIPQSDKNKLIPHYRYPQSLDLVNGSVVSKLSIDELTGKIYWAQPGEPGNYNIAVDIKEWRYVEENDAWTEISATTYDFYFRILDTDNHPPLITTVRDTAILPSQDLDLSFILNDMENDNFSIRVTGSVFNLPSQKPEISLADSLYYSGSVSGQLHWEPVVSDVRLYPYSLVLETEDSNREVLTGQQVTYIWVTGQETDPDPPVDLEAFSTHAGEMNLTWKNPPSPAAGYIVERADDYYPDFRRLTGISSRSEAYIDKQVIPGRNYRYRLKALGTKQNRYSEILQVPGDIVLNTDQLIIDKEFDIFPNPASTILNIRLDHQIADPIKLRIFDLAGKLVSVYTFRYPAHEEVIRVPVVQLRTGYYLVRIQYGEVSRTYRFLKG
jgi:hypothetical protein